MRLGNLVAVSWARVAAAGWWLGLAVAAGCAEPAGGSTGDPAAGGALLDTPPSAGAQGGSYGAAGFLDDTSSGFLGVPERALLDRLAQGQVTGIKKGTGGRSLAFKLELEDGTQGYFKPEQTFSGTLWFAEVVAHYLDRALALGRVPPVVARQLHWAPLAQAAEGDTRLREVIVQGDGSVRGALIAWLSEPLEPARTPPGWENWVRIEPLARYAITPYQRPAAYSEALQRFHARIADGQGGDEYYQQAPAPDRPERGAELSDLLLFDFLTLNIDRWGGGNGNVLLLGHAGPLIFLDNAAGFSPGPPQRGLMDDRLQLCQRFRKRTIAALQALDVGTLGRVMARDPLAPLLTDEQLDGLALRRRVVLEQVTLLRKRFGDDAVLPW
jgi:hypothetical protein